MEDNKDKEKIALIRSISQSIGAEYGYAPDDFDPQEALDNLFKETEVESSENYRTREDIHSLLYYVVTTGTFLNEYEKKLKDTLEENNELDDKDKLILTLYMALRTVSNRYLYLIRSINKESSTPVS